MLLVEDVNDVSKPEWSLNPYTWGLSRWGFSSTVLHCSSPFQILTDFGAFKLALPV